MDGSEGTGINPIGANDSSESELIRAADFAAQELSSAICEPRRATLAFPGYECVREICRGGQGVVYRAVQSGTGRDVAIKVLRTGPRSEAGDRARFLREVRTLGRLQHPNIVTIHDTGISSDCQYFVMDYIPGQPLDTYLSTHELPISETLTLFLKICGAVHDAHVRGVVHRDLKPGNIRVGSAGEPFVLDFGLAKIETAGSQPVTITGQFVGTLPWASPEQVLGSPDDVDLRTDIYALGLLLCHMLTGRLPYRFARNVRDEMTNIVDMDPVRPTMLREDLDEDLDVVVLKCLAKSPKDRYQSVAALADDVRRFLNHEPILARAPSALYQLNRLVQRHPWPFLLAAALLLVAMGSAILMSVLYAQATRARYRAEEAEVLAEERRVKAEQEADTSKAIQEFLVHDLLASATPELALGRKVTVEEVLANAARSIAGAFEGRPEVEASTRTTLGRVYLSLGLYRKAEEQFREAVDRLTEVHGPRHLKTLTLKNEWIQAGLSCGPQWNPDVVSADFLADCRGTLGDDHVTTLNAGIRRAEALGLLGDWASGVQLLSEIVDRLSRVYGEDDPLTLEAHTMWAQWTLRTAIRRRELAGVLEEALARNRRTLGEKHPQTLQAMVNLGSILAEQRRFADAEPLIRDGCAGLGRVLGESHPNYLLATRDLIMLLRERNQMREAARVSRQTVEMALQTVGPEHPLTLEARYYLGTSLFRTGCQSEAAAILRDIWERRRRHYGDEAISTLQSLGVYSFSLMNLGRYAEAERGFRQVDEADVEEVGNHTRCDAWCLRQLVRTLAAQGRSEEARPFAERMLAERRQPAMLPDADAYALNSYAHDLLTVEPTDLRDPEEALRVAKLAFERSEDEYHFNRFTLARAYEANGRWDEAIEFAQRALAASPLEPSTERSDYEAALVRALESVGDEEGAEEVYRSTLEARRAQPVGYDGDVAASLYDLGTLLVKHRRFAEAEPILQECLETQEGLLAEPTEDVCPLTLDCDIGRTMTMLGRCGIESADYTAAEPWLVPAYDRLSSNDCHLDHVQETARLLVTLYEALGRPDRATHYARIASRDANHP